MTPINPKDYKPNEAWVAFILNTVKSDEGVHNIFVVMDVGSEYAIGHALAEEADNSPPFEQIESIFLKGKSTGGAWPGKLFVDNSIPKDNSFNGVAMSKEIAVEYVGAKALSKITSSLRDSFRESKLQQAVVESHEAPNENSVVKKEFSPYAPIRFRNEIWWLYSIEAAKQGLVKPDGMITSDFGGRISEELISPMAEMAVQHMSGTEEEHALGDTLAAIHDIYSWAPMIGQYELNGRQIFDLHDGLVDMLEQTDLSDVTLEDWHAPYDAFFVRFGRRDDIKMVWEESKGTYEYLDGVFVGITPHDERGGRRIKLAFTTVLEDGRGTMLPGYFMDITPSEQLLPIRDAIKASLDRKKAELRKILDINDAPNYQSMVHYETLRYEEAADLLLMSVELIVNALFYLENASDYQYLSPGRDTPPDLEAKWHNTQPNKRYKMRSRLTKDGYTLVYLLGKEEADNSINTPGRRSIKIVFWRRGHWRWQRYGQQLSKKKRIWIKPVMVGTSNGPQRPPGHIYMTGSSDASRKH